MDPLSIASAAIAISAAVARILYSVGSFAAAANDVDENLQSLHVELSTLHGSVSSIASSFQVPAFAAAAKAVSDEYRNSIWTHLQSNLENCTITLSRLELILQDVRGKNKQNFIGKGIRQWQLGDKIGEINSLRLQVQSYNGALHTVLQAFQLCLQLQSTARDVVAAEKLNFSVQLLSEQIENQNGEIRELKAMIKERSTDDNDLNTQNLAKMLSDMEYLQDSTIHLRYAASVVAAERSTVAGSDRNFGSSAMSEAGVPLSTRRRNEVLGWIQEEPVGDNTETEVSGGAPAIQRITSAPDSLPQVRPKLEQGPDSQIGPRRFSWDTATSMPEESTLAFPSSISGSKLSQKSAPVAFAGAEGLSISTPLDFETSVTDSAVLMEDFERNMAQITARAQGQKKSPFDDDDFLRISDLLRRVGKPTWADRPRTYLVLRLIDQVHTMNNFVFEGLKDIAIPYEEEQIPAALDSPESRHAFLQKQSLVLISDKAKDIITKERRHRHLNKDADAYFKRVRILGNGGFGVVDHVISRYSLEAYARKRIHRSRAFSRNKEEMRLFETELDALKKLNHRHLVKLISSYSDPKYIGLIISPVADCDLRFYLSRSPFLEEYLPNLRSFFACLCSAIKYLHEQKVRHKDIKPGNILIKDDRLYVTDFGTSFDWSDRQSDTTTGRPEPFTPEFAAPEVLFQQKRNSSSDIWSLGCVFLEITTVLKGETPDSRKAFFRQIELGGEHSIARTTVLYANRKALDEWITILEAKSPYDQKPLFWVRQMTEWNSEDRISASELMDSILGYKDSHAYYASCCKFDDDDDDGHMSSYHGSASEDEDYASASSMTRGTTVSASEVYTPRSIARNLSEFEALPSPSLPDDGDSEQAMAQNPAHEAKNFKIPRFSWQENTSTISRRPVASSPVEIKLPRFPWQENTSTQLPLPPVNPSQNAFATATSAKPLSAAVEKEEIAEPIAHSTPEEPVPGPSLTANVLQDGVLSPHSAVSDEISPQKADISSASKKEEVGCSVGTLLPATAPSPTKTDDGPNSPQLRAPQGYSRSGPRETGSQPAANANPFLHLLTSTAAVGMPLNTTEFGPPPTHVETDPSVSTAHSASSHAVFTSQSTTAQHLMDLPVPEFDVNTTLSRWSNFFEFESLVLKLRSNSAADWRKSLNFVVAATAADPSANSALHFAVRLSDPQIAVDVTVALLENSILTGVADVKAVNAYGDTPLHEAVKEGRLTLIKLLIEYGAETSTQNLRGQNALHLAVETSRLDVVRHVVNYSPTEVMQAKTISGKTPLELSTEDEITTFLTKGITNLDAQGEAEPSTGDHSGPGLECGVVGSPRQEPNANLLAVDVDATMLRKSKSTSRLGDPILPAELEASHRVSQGPVELPGKLDERVVGESPNDPSRSHSTKLGSSARRKASRPINWTPSRVASGESPSHVGLNQAVQQEVVNPPILETESARPPPLKRKINFKELSSYRAQLERQKAEREGTTGNETSQATRTLSARRKPNISLEPAVLARAEKRLEEAGFKGDNSFLEFPTVALIWTLENLPIISPLDGIVTLLLRSGADIDTVNDHGQTMMHLAAEHGMTDIAEILLKFGAHTELRDRSQLVPLHYAIKSKNLGIVSLLLDHGADIEAFGADLYRPLSYAIKTGNRPVVNLLLARNANVHQYPKRMPLLYAAQLGRWDIMADLLYQRPLIDLDDKDGLGNTAIHYAVEAGELGLLNLLFKKGADMKTINIEGKTPLDLALKRKGMKNYQEIVELLGGKVKEKKKKKGIFGL